MATKERNYRRRTYVYNHLEEVKFFVDKHGNELLWGWNPKPYNSFRVWLESIRKELDYAEKYSWRSIWLCIQRDYVAIQAGWTP